MTEEGWYLVEAEGDRYVAEFSLGAWLIPGIDYDYWKESGIEVTILAKVDIDTLEHLQTRLELAEASSAALLGRVERLKNLSRNRLAKLRNERRRFALAMEKEK